MALDVAGVRLLPSNSNGDAPPPPSADWIVVLPAAAAVEGVDDATTTGRSGDRSGELEQYESRLVFNARLGFGGALAYNGCL